LARARSADSKHHEVFSALSQEIQSGRWSEGERLPSEAQLIERFGHSRITIVRALTDLQTAGFIRRRAGAGSFVHRRGRDTGRSFGLLIADLGETDIFESICRGMMASPLAREHALLWGSASPNVKRNGTAVRPPGGVARGDALLDTDVDEVAERADRAWGLCKQYIDRRVDGVFFAPVELTPSVDDVNQRIVRALDDARIPIVLLDRPVTAYPEPGYHDLVGIDNRRAGYVMTEHLLSRGARRILFVRQPNSAPTVDAREAGFREAMFAHHAPFERIESVRLDPADNASLHAMLKSHTPDGIVCANDRTAAGLMHTLLRLRVRVPQDVRIVGIDDVDYAPLLPVPLTTFRQPTRELGEVALSAMLARVAQPEMPARDVRLRCEIVVRESCGAPAT